MIKNTFPCEIRPYDLSVSGKKKKKIKQTGNCFIP